MEGIFSQTLSIYPSRVTSLPNQLQSHAFHHGTALSLSPTRLHRWSHFCWQPRHPSTPSVVLVVPVWISWLSSAPGRQQWGRTRGHDRELLRSISSLYLTVGPRKWTREEL
jgi:hypothetical protein